MISNIEYNIISTGSQGNAVVINDFLLIDCGVPFKALKPYYQRFKLVLMTHIHSDHFCKSAIRTLARERPTLRFACGRWLVQPLLDCGVSKGNIDVVEFDKWYDYGLVKISPVALKHNVLNQGYKVYLSNGKKLIYATDTNNLNGITAPNYDLYLIEANYEDDVIQKKIKEKESRGEYAYEKQVLKNHLSKAKCDDFLYSNMGPNSTYVYMHCHEDKEDQSDADFSGNIAV